MKKYIGTKIIYAEPQDKDGVHGYKVMYKDGYISWSPAHAFEEAYRPIEEIDFDIDEKDTAYRDMLILSEKKKGG